jgi:RNA polymerase sigma-70 factor (ECF subfamily)
MNQSIPDEELMGQVRNGIGEMLGVLFERYQSPLFNFYLRLTGDRSVSEDLVQEVFLRILKYRHSYQPETPFRAWIYQIARNARVDHFRKNRPETSLEPEMSPAVIPNDVAQEEQEAALLRRALLELSEEKREVLVLSRFQDLKYEQIANIMDCEVNTVKVRVHRALQDLRRIYEALQRGRFVRNPHERDKDEGHRISPGSLQ